MNCDVLRLYELFGKKWSYGLLHNITEEPKSFNDLHNLSNRKINPTLLSQRLKELESLKLIERKEEDERVFYTITGAGQKLKDIFRDVKDLAQNLNLEMPEKCEEGSCSKCPSYNKVS